MHVYWMLLTESNDAVVAFQIHLHGIPKCSEWIDADKLIKFNRIAMELTSFIERKCNCPFPSSSITTSQFTCDQSHERHVTYRASVSTGSLNRLELVAALEEWPRVHRSILLQGERLSVNDTCPIIIQSLDEEECGGPSQQPSGSVALSTILSTTVSAIIVVFVVMIALFSCNFKRIKK